MSLQVRAWSEPVFRDRWFGWFHFGVDLRGGALRGTHTWHRWPAGHQASQLSHKPSPPPALLAPVLPEHTGHRSQW